MRKIKQLCFLATLILVTSWLALLGGVQSSETLPDIKSLPELELKLVLDLADHPDVGLPVVGRITPQGEFVFFDSRLRQVMIMSLDGQSIRTIGRFGEGPGEYQRVRDILVDADSILILDGRGLLIEYNREGTLQHEMKLPFGCSKILGRSENAFYLVGRSASADEFFERVAIKWTEGAEAKTLCKMKAELVRTMAYGDDGKKLQAGGLVSASEPAFAFLGDRIAAAAGSHYLIQFFDLSGKERTVWKVEALKPEFSGSLSGFFKDRAQAYAIREIFVLPDRLVVVGNFYRDGKPRLDCFNLQGKLTSSWLIPLADDPPSSHSSIEPGYLIYFSLEEGCRIYRILSRL
ncbi:MAG: 6-bladed beta-propeller [Acidobacteriota bacterium]|nr:6-bladed beta-propeller [Acidobacteriota bacterium]MDW3229941.1 6-bladed beta-propeller [Acidobacteriota bacterium]MDY0232111.1 6-bladed beta-propeller [Candidatus Saccharicenans sp.]